MLCARVCSASIHLGSASTYTYPHLPTPTYTYLQVLALHARGQLVRHAASDNPERLVPQGDWKELNFVFKGAHAVHACCTARALHARCTRAARALLAHCMRIACALHPHFNLLVGHAFTPRVRLPLPPALCALPGTWNPRAMELLPGTFKVVTSLPEASSMVLGATSISNRDS